MEAIILAGGIGSRLRSVVEDRPKPMALIGDKPFLTYWMDWLIDSGITHFILSVGYKAAHIQAHFADSYRGCKITYAIEQSQLGTGGAIKNAMQYVKEKHCIVTNGDSFFKVDIQAQYKKHLEAKADVTLALKPMKNVDRYGTIILAADHTIACFKEKQNVAQGLINGGVYIFNADKFKTATLPDKFAIEKDYFATHNTKIKCVGFIADTYFLDIGIPEDFLRAQYEINTFQKVDTSWTLFLDRDGVINEKRNNDYVKTLGELVFCKGAVEAIASLSHIFGRIIIVTNQQGIGKGLMTTDDLVVIHQHIIQAVKQKNGKIDAIYYAPQLSSEESQMRKPAIGMAHQAKKDFPEINFSKSIMVGDSESDIRFAQNANMLPIFLGEKTNVYTISSLNEFSKLLNSIQQK